MPRFSDQAICIRLIDWSETSQIVALLTREHGKLRGLAKGSRRSSPGAVARFSGGVDLLTQGEVVATTKSTSDLATITEWDLQQPYPHLRNNLQAQRFAMFAADLAGAMLADHDPHPVVFAAMERLLSDLGDEEKRIQSLLIFQWSLLEDCGYKPKLQKDVVNGDVLSGQTTFTFDPRAGGLTETPSPTARSGQTNAAQFGPWRVRAGTVELLRKLSAGSMDIDASDDTLDRANRLLCVYVRAILDRQLPTMDFVLK